MVTHKVGPYLRPFSAIVFAAPAVSSTLSLMTPMRVRYPSHCDNACKEPVSHVETSHELADVPALTCGWLITRLMLSLVVPGSASKQWFTFKLT